MKFSLCGGDDAKYAPIKIIITKIIYIVVLLSPIRYCQYIITGRITGRSDHAEGFQGVACDSLKPSLSFIESIKINSNLGFVDL